MANVVSTVKRADDKINFLLSLTYREIVNLNGQMENVRLFSDDNFKSEAKVVCVKQKGSKVPCLTIPKDCGKDINAKSIVYCQKLNLKNKKFLIYLIED